MTSHRIRFGTDGWRGIIADEFTFDRLRRVAVASAQVLAATYGSPSNHRTIAVGYDRRFLSPEFARAVAESVSRAGFDVLLASGFAPTPALSWAARDRQALGALVITASHNPAIYSGLKIKGAFGGSVSPAFTQQVEALLGATPPEETVTPGQIEPFDPWVRYCDVLREKVNLAAIRDAIARGRLRVLVDVMHGAAATGLSRLLDVLPSEAAGVVELRGDADPTFGGGSPEPIAPYLRDLCAQTQAWGERYPDSCVVGLAFDGDGDRIAASDRHGNYLSSQALIPIAIEHLALRRGLRGEVVKTVSGSDLFPKVAALFDLSTCETPIGFKYIADRMMGTGAVLLGGEESGGIGYGTHIPERDALLSALYLLEAVALSGQDMDALFASLQARTQFHATYDRLDKRLTSMEARDRLAATLQRQPLTHIAGRAVAGIDTTDGLKYRLADGHWLLIRFSGTEPVLRLYCEAPTPDLVRETLAWIADWVEAI